MKLSKFNDDSANAVVIIYNRDTFIKVRPDLKAEIGSIIHNCFLSCAVK